MLPDDHGNQSGNGSEARAEIERRYNQLLGVVSDYVCSIRVRDGRAVETRHNENCIAITGYTPEEFVSDPMLWIRLVVREDRPLVTRQAEEILTGGGARSIVHRIRRKDGAIRWVLNTPIPFTDADGKLARYDAVIRDVTGRATATSHNTGLAARVNEASEFMRDDLMQLLTAARFRMESLAGDPIAAPGFAEALRDVLELLEQCGQKARTISQDLAACSGLDYL